MRTVIATLTTLLVLAACTPGDEATPDATADTAAVAPPAAPAVMAPDTTAEALWAHLQQQSYARWSMWPGTSALYAGTEPHGMLLTTYVNELALDALTNGAATMPAGAIVVKENYMPDSTLAALTVMHKVTGYDAANADWYWAKYDTQGVPEVAGRAPMCAQCHSQARDRDYLITARN